MPTIVESVGRGGANRPADVEVVQVLINKHIGMITPLRPLGVDGRVGPNTVGAIEEFQRRVLEMAEPDGRVDPHGRTLKALITGKAVETAGAAPYGTRQQEQPTAKWVGIAASESSWMSIAGEEVGQKEKKGHAANNPRILEYIATFPALKKILVDKDNKSGPYLGEVDETAWCACFVNWCMIQAGRKRGPSARAKDWLNYGAVLDTPVPGALTIIYKAPKTSTDKKMTPSGYHIGFYVRGGGSSITLLGGNQGDQVKEATFTGYTVMGYRWPQ